MPVTHIPVSGRQINAADWHEDHEVELTAAEIEAGLGYTPADVTHNHDDRYYTETEVNDLLAGLTSDPVPNGLQSGGIVTWVSAYTFEVSAAVYYINGVRYTAAQQTVTLDAADGTNDRIDVLALDTAGDFVAVPGTPASTPSEPDVDPLTQLRLTFVLVEAASTEPVGVTILPIYLENTEWTTSTSGSGFNANSTNNPKSGTKAVEVTNAGSNAYVLFDKGAVDLDINDYRLLRIYIRSKASWPTNKLIRLQFYANGVAKGSPVTLAQGYWGFDSTNTTTYQLVAIPISQFVIPDGTLIDQLRMTSIQSGGGGGALGFYADEITLESYGEGIGQPADFTPLPLTFNFTDSAVAYFGADVAMTLTQQWTEGAGSIAYEKSTAAAPTVYASTASPIALQAGARLKVTATGAVAVHLKRTA